MVCRMTALEKRIAATPTFQTFQLKVERVGDGAAILKAPYSRQYDGIFESFHGGMLTMLADTAACLAVLSLAGADARITTTDMHIRFLSACRTDATADARIIKFGKTLCPVAVSVRDADGSDVAVAQVTYMRLSK